MEITHIIQRDKFTNGYINFMRTEFPHHSHHFITGSEDYIIEDKANVIELRNINDAYTKCVIDLERANCIVISGVSTSTRGMSELISRNLLKKTFFHFWGGDFYCYRVNSHNPKYLLGRQIKYYAFSHAFGLIFLINGEYDVFNQITGVTNKHFVAAMPEAHHNLINYKKYRDIKKEGLRTNVIIGNSSTRTNHHKEAFQSLEHMKDNIDVYCPLSYGDVQYRDEIIAYGRTLFGSHFFPIVEQLKIDEYINYLGKMDIAIYNNDRQQAMGNINLMLGLGKKVFISENTSMWREYQIRGYSIYVTEKISNMNYKEFLSFPHSEYTKNIEVFDSTDTWLLTKKQWSLIFNEFHINRT